MKYWLVKSEPVKYSFENLQKDKKTFWNGVRNYQARNHLRAMNKGDLVLFYHSNEGKEIVGISEVVKEAYPDQTAKDGDWSMVDLKAVKKLDQSVTLLTIKNDPLLREISLVKQSRLSVMPIDKKHFEKVLKISGTELK